jgi:methylenetetrahydrofolate dehydrogenase (NADP+) / methenyltetrahydrofolate cyclohydrolase
MTATIIDGKLVAKEIRKQLKERIAALKVKGIVPGLAAVLVGDNPGSAIYVAKKAEACEKLGLYSEVFKRPPEFSQADLVKLVGELNANEKVHGILVQSPLPSQVDELSVTLAIDPEKDVDGFHPFNVGMALIGRPRFVSATPLGITKILEYYSIDTRGKEVVVVGRSNIVGKPMAFLLMQKGMLGDATVTVAHSRTPDLAAVTRRADILIAAIGRPEMITADMVKEGAVVIDVGTNRVDDPTSEKGYRLCGDVAFDQVFRKASFISPYPGGVGPMTITMVVHNTVVAAEHFLERASRRGR